MPKDQAYADNSFPRPSSQVSLDCVKFKVKTKHHNPMEYFLAPCEYMTL